MHEECKSGSEKLDERDGSAKKQQSGGKERGGGGVERRVREMSQSTNRKSGRGHPEAEI